MHWLVDYSKGKGLRASILKLAAAETIYGIWSYRNDKFWTKVWLTQFEGEIY